MNIGKLRKMLEIYEQNFVESTIELKLHESKLVRGYMSWQKFFLQIMMKIKLLLRIGQMLRLIIKFKAY